MDRFDTVGYKKVVENQKKPEVFIKTKKTEQVHIALGIRTVPNEHPDKYPLSLLATVLGGGMSSRLFHEVREKRGLAYYVRSSSDHYIDCGNLVSTAGVDPKRVKEAVKVMVEEYGKIANKLKVSESELKKAKEFSKGHLVLEFEDSRSVAGFYAGQELLERKIDNPNEVLAKIDKVTLDKVRTAARKYMVNKNLNLAVIGNFEDRQMFESLLHL